MKLRRVTFSKRSLNVSVAQVWYTVGVNIRRSDVQREGRGK